MEETKKTRGAWVIHVKGPDDGQGTDVGCSPTPGGGTPHSSEQRNMNDKKEE